MTGAFIWMSASSHWDLNYSVISALANSISSQPRPLRGNCSSSSRHQSSDLWMMSTYRYCGGKRSHSRLAPCCIIHNDGAMSTCNADCSWSQALVGRASSGFITLDNHIMDNIFKHYSATEWSKKQATKFLSMIKYPITPQTRRYTTVLNIYVGFISILELNINIMSPRE